MYEDGVQDVADDGVDSTRQRSNSPCAFRGKAVVRVRSGDVTGSFTPGGSRAPFYANRGVNGPANNGGRMPYRTSAEGAILSSVTTAMEKKFETFADQYTSQLEQLKSSNKVKETAILSLQEKVNSSEGPKTDRQVAQMMGTYRGLSDEMQAQIRRVDAVEERVWQNRHSMEDDFRHKHGELDSALQKLQSRVNVLQASTDEEMKKVKERLRRIENHSDRDDRVQFGDPQDIYSVSTRLEDLERRCSTNDQFSRGVGGVTDTAQFAVFKQICDDIDEKYKQLQSEVYDKLHSQVKVHEERITTLRTLLDAREEQIRWLCQRMTLNDWDSKFEVIQRQLKEHSSSKVEYELKFDSLEKRFNDQVQSHVELRHNVRNTTNQLRRGLFEGGFREADMGGDGVEENVMDLPTSSLVNRLNEYENQMNKLGEEVDELRSDAKLPHLNALVKELKDISPKVIKNDQILNNLVNEVNTQFKDILPKIITNEQIVNNLVNDVEALSATNNQVKTGLQDFERGLNNLNSDLGDFNGRHRGLEGQLNSLRARHDDETVQQLREVVDRFQAYQKQRDVEFDTYRKQHNEEFLDYRKTTDGKLFDQQQQAQRMCDSIGDIEAKLENGVKLGVESNVDAEKALASLAVKVGDVDEELKVLRASHKNNSKGFNERLNGVQNDLREIKAQQDMTANQVRTNNAKAQETKQEVRELQALHEDRSKGAVQKMAVIENNFRDLQARHDEHGRGAVATTQQVKAVEDELWNLQKKVIEGEDAARSVTTALTQKMKSVEEDLKDLAPVATKVEGLRNEVDASVARHDEGMHVMSRSLGSSDQFQSLEKQIRKLQFSNEDCEGKLCAITAQLMDLGTKVDVDQIQSLESKVLSGDQSLESKIRQLHFFKEDCAGKFSVLSAQMTDLTSNLQTLNAVHEEHKESIAGTVRGLDDNIKGFIATHDEHKENVHGKVRDVDDWHKFKSESLDRDIEDLRSRSNVRDAELAENKRKLREQNEMMQKANEHVAALESELRNIRDSIPEQQSGLIDAEEHKRATEAEIRKVMDAQTKKTKALEDKFDSLRSYVLESIDAHAVGIEESKSGITELSNHVPHIADLKDKHGQHTAELLQCRANTKRLEEDTVDMVNKQQIDVEKLRGDLKRCMTQDEARSNLTSLENDLQRLKETSTVNFQEVRDALDILKRDLAPAQRCVELAAHIGDTKDELSRTISDLQAEVRELPADRVSIFENPTTKEDLPLGIPQAADDPGAAQIQSMFKSVKDDEEIEFNAFLKLIARVDDLCLHIQTLDKTLMRKTDHVY